MAKTHIRPARASDFPTLLQIDQASFPPGIAYDFSELSFFMQSEGAHTLVAESDDGIAGFILVEIVRKRRLATLITLDVLERYRRLGLATQLLNSSESILGQERVERYQLQVDVENRGAIEFYQKNGFATVRRLPHYYPNGNDAYFMAKPLAPVRPEHS